MAEKRLVEICIVDSNEEWEPDCGIYKTTKTHDALWDELARIEDAWHNQQFDINEVFHRVSRVGDRQKPQSYTVTV